MNTAPKTFIPTVEFVITHAVIHLGLQIHQNMGDNLKRRCECGTLTNATAVITEMALMQMRSYL